MRMPIVRIWQIFKPYMYAQTQKSFITTKPKIKIYPYPGSRINMIFK